MFFTTNESGASFIRFAIENRKLAEICEKHGTRMIVEGDKLSYEADLDGRWISHEPRGGDFAEWILETARDLDLADRATCDEISAQKEEINNALISSDIVYEYYNTEDDNFASHWEERRTKDDIEVRGFDAFSWEKVWNSEDHQEIAGLYGGPADNIEKLSPDECPFWKFLSEGWDPHSDGTEFVSKMMDKYGTFRISKNAGYENPEYEALKNKTIDPDTIDFSGKTIGMAPVAYLYPDDRENKYFGSMGTAFDIAKTIVEQSGGKVTKSVSGNTDYVVVSSRMRLRDQRDAVRIAEDYRMYCDNQKRNREKIQDGDEKRRKKNKPEIRVIFEDEFHAWLRNRFDEMKQESDVFRPYGTIDLIVRPFDISPGAYTFKFRSDHFADIPEERMKEATDDLKSLSEFVSNIESFTKEGVFAESGSTKKTYDQMMELDEKYKFSDYEEVFFIYESSADIKYRIIKQTDPGFDIQHVTADQLRDAPYVEAGIRRKLMDGRKVKVRCRLSDENGNAGDEIKVLNELAEKLAKFAHTENGPEREGNALCILFAPGREVSGDGAPLVFKRTAKEIVNKTHIDALRINDSFDASFLSEIGEGIRRVVIPSYTKSYNRNSMMLSRCPNVEEFIVGKNSDFTFENGVLYASAGNTRAIVYITKNTRELHIDKDITEISNWHGVDRLTIDKDNGTFAVQDNMLLSRRLNSLYFVCGDAEEVVIPEGVTQIHSEAFRYCEKLKRVVFPASYEWRGWYAPPGGPILNISEGMRGAEVVIKGDKSRYENEMVILSPDFHPNAKLYLGDPELCRIPDKITSHYGFTEAFGNVRNFEVGEQNPMMTSVDGVILDKGKTKLLYYPVARDTFTIPDCVTSIGDMALSNCNRLTDVIIPEQVVSVGSMAFANCEKLTSVTVMNPGAIVAENAFLGCHFEEGGADQTVINEEEIKKSVEDEIAEITRTASKGKKAKAADRQNGPKKQFRYTDYLTFDLPEDFVISTSTDDEGNELTMLQWGDYKDEDSGDTLYQFNATLAEIPVEAESDGKTLSPDEIIDAFINGSSGELVSRTYIAHGDIPYGFFSTEMPLEVPMGIFGNIVLKNYIVTMGVVAGGKVVMAFSNGYSNPENDDDCEKEDLLYEKLVEIVSGISVNGVQIDCGDLDAAKLKEVVGPLFEDAESTFSLDLGAQQEQKPEVRFDEKDDRKVIVDDKWSFELPEGLELRFDSEHVDIMGSSTTAKYVVEGLQYNGRFFFDFELRERFDDGMSTDVDVIGCRFDNSVTSGNAEQKILIEGDDLFVDMVTKPVFLFNSMAMIRVRGDDIRPWDFTAGLRNTDQDMSARWDEVQELMRKLAESIQLLGGSKKSSKKKKKEEPSSDPDFIISNGVLRKYTGKKDDIVIPDGVKEIADSTFSGFTKLRSVVVPEGVKRIGRRCFENCIRLRSCSLPESLTELGGYAFVDCHELEEVYLSEKVKTLGDSTFSECFVLKDVKIPKKVKEIDAFTFKNCDAFTHIVIPEGVKSIGFSAFAGCDNLEYLFVPKSVTDIAVDFMGGHPFSGSEKLKIYTPEGSYAQKFAEEKGIPFENAAKGKVIADNAKAKSGPSDARSESAYSAASDEGLAYSAPRESFYALYNSRDELMEALQQKGIKPDDIAVSSDVLPAGTIIDVNNLCSSELIVQLDDLIDYYGTPITVEEAVGKKLKKKTKAITAISEKMLDMNISSNDSSPDDLNNSKTDAIEMADDLRKKKEQAEGTGKSANDNNGRLVFVDRVKVPGQNWSIGVPEGFEYSTDPEVNGESSANPSGVYDLILAKPKSKRDVDFDSPYNNAISFVTLEYSSFHAFEMDLNIKKDEYEKVLLTDDLSVILIPMMSTGGVNSYYIYVNSEEKIRRCQLLISGPYKKEKKLEIARQLAESISLSTPEDSFARKSASAPKSSGRSSSGKAKAKKPAAGGKTVTVDNTWTVTIPEGYKYSTDKNKIGGHRNIIFMEDKAGNTFDWPFDATISFTSQFNDSQGAPAPELAKMMAGIFGDSINVIRDDDDLYVGTYLFSKSSGEGDADVYKIDIGCGAGVSSIQVFFNRKLPGREEKKLVDTVAKSVKLVSEEAAFTPSSSSPLSAEQQKQKAELDRQIEDLRSQAAFYSSQDLSAEDRETLANAKKDLEKLEKQMGDVSADQAKFEEYLRQKEEKEKQREEERRRKEAEAMAAGKGEKDLVNMFVILCNEDKVKTLQEKTQKEFFDAYGDCFPGYKTRELGELRKEVKAKIKDKETRRHFIESFLERSVEDRYDIATLTYFSLDQYADYTLRAEDAIIKTAEWYTPEEMPEVRTLMEKQLNKNRREVDDAFDPVETKWKSYWSAKEFLKIVVRDGSGEKVRQDCRQFQTLVPNNILTGPLMVEVSLATKGVFQMSTPVMDFFSCYWDVSKDEIWEKASKNEIKDESTAYIEDINESVRSAIRDIKEKYPDVRAILKQWNDSTVSRAKSLVVYLSMLYEKTDQHFTMAEIKEKLKSAYKTPAELAEGKEKLFEYAKREDLTCLRELINSKSDIREIYDSIPRTLSEDIKKVRKEKELEESERRYSEAVELMSAGEFAGCIKAEEILKSLGDFKDSKDLLKQISNSIGSKKTEQYKEAVSLVEEGTEDTIAKAIELMEGLGSYKDAPDKAAEYKKTLELERKYENALNLLGKEELNDVMQAREIFESLGEYRDSGEQAITSAEKISGIKAKMYEEALLLEKEETKESLTEAKVILIAIKPYRDVEDRIRNIDRLSIAVDKYKTADEKARGADLKDLEEAEKLFRSIEDYKDAGERADECQARFASLYEEKLESAQKAAAFLSVKSQNDAIFYYKELAEWYDVEENIANCEENISLIKEVIKINHVLDECRAELSRTGGRKWKKPIKTLIEEKEKEFSALKQRLYEINGTNKISISESGIEPAELGMLKTASPELAEIRKANEKGRKSARWRNIVIIVFLIVLGFAIVFSLPYIFKPDLSEYESVNESSVHGMTYEIPDEWKIDDSVSGEDYRYYTYENNDRIVAVTLIEYKGEDDLSGKAAFDDYTESRTIPPEVLEIIPDAEGIYKTINKDHSVFKVFVYCNPEMVDNQEEFLDDLCDSFRTDEYENPRKAYMVVVKYNGDTEEGTVIDKFSSYIEVYEVYDTGSEKGTKAAEWTLKEPVTLKAGETSKLTVIVDGKEYSTDVRCSTKPEDSKLNKDGEDSEEGTDDDDSGSKTGRTVDSSSSSGGVSASGSDLLHLLND